MFDYFTLNNSIRLLQIALDISILWIVLYYCLKIVKNNSRTIQIFKGILLVVLIKGLATLLGLSTVEYLSDIFVRWGILAVIIIFQPEIRSLLEKLGKSNVFSRISTLTINEREKLVDELVKACTEMSKTKTGALISLEQGHALSDFIKTGTAMNSVVSSELLCSIFQYGTPLHDGAVIIQGVKIACAAAYFPPTTLDLPTSYGARHRAAVGISEITDSITIVVSEETGNISIAEDGKLTVVSEKSLREFLLMVICQMETEVANDKFKRTSDMEKDVVQIEEDKINEEANAGKFASYLRSRSKKNKDKSEKDIRKDEKDKKKLEKKKLEKKVQKIGIENLVEETPELDSLFDTIVTDKEVHKGQAKKEEEMKEYLKMARPRYEEKKETTNVEKEDVKKLDEEKQTKTTSKDDFRRRRVIKRAHKNEGVYEDSITLIDDVIEPEAVVLNYKPKKKESSPKKDLEGSDK